MVTDERMWATDHNFGDARYEFQRMLAIKDDWIYLEGEKLGINEAGYKGFVPGDYLDIYINGGDWKEVTQEKIPGENEMGRKFELCGNSWVDLKRENLYNISIIKQGKGVPWIPLPCFFVRMVIPWIV